MIKPFTHTLLLEALLQGFGQNKPPLTLPGTWPLPGDMLKNLKGKHILLVEDNEINQVVAMDLLQNMGLLVSLAENGEKALKMVGCGNFDAILMDIQMPGMDGYQVTAQIRRDPRFNAARLPIIAMTAHALESDRRKSLEAGLNDYVSKPVDVTNLANVLVRWLHHVTIRTEHAEVFTVDDSIDQHAIQTSEYFPESLSNGRMDTERDDLPASQESIDMSAALARLGDNKKLYRKLLLMFYKEHSQDVHAIRAALKTDDNELALRLSHSLKGLAGTIGAVDLIASAKGLETVIYKGGLPLYDEYLEQLDHNLALVITAIARMN